MNREKLVLIHIGENIIAVQESYELIDELIMKNNTGFIELTQITDKSEPFNFDEVKKESKKILVNFSHVKLVDSNNEVIF